jgi:hypothetical protein
MEQRHDHIRMRIFFAIALAACRAAPQSPLTLPEPVLSGSSNVENYYVVDPAPNYFPDGFLRAPYDPCSELTIELRPGARIDGRYFVDGIYVESRGPQFPLRWC